MTDRLEGGPIKGFTLGPVRPLTPLEQDVADLSFQVRRLQDNLDNLESRLQEAIDDIAALQRPRDVRYVRGQLRGRS